MTEAPLIIDGFVFLRGLGSFEIGDSFLYEQSDSNRQLHVLLGRGVTDVDELMTKFEQTVGSEALRLIEFAGLTDRGRPYLVTGFLDEQNLETTLDKAPDSRRDEPPASLPDDQTRRSVRTDVSDETLLSARGARVPATQPERAEPDDHTVVSPSRKPVTVPRRIPSLVVSEREAHIPHPARPADDARYQPRGATPVGEAPTNLNQPPNTEVIAPPVHRFTREAQRARWSLAIIGASIAVSLSGGIGFLVWLLAR